MRRRLLILGALTGAALAGSAATVAVVGGSPAPAAPALPSVSTATVVRTDLVSSVLTEGYLGYAPTEPLVNHLQGTYTYLPATGREVGQDGVLYRVDDQPVVLMAGEVPAWRAFGLGMTDGPDVRELESNLIAFGFARGLLTEPSDHFDLFASWAVQRWQTSLGYAPDGEIPLGEIVFFPAPVLVGVQNIAVGDPAAPGDDPYQVTSTRRTVTVPLAPTLPSVSVGEEVSIVLPDGSGTPGTVASIVSAPPGDSGSQGSSGSGSGAGSGSGSGSGNGPQAASDAIVTLADPTATGDGLDVPVQVALTSQSARGVLAVPITALLALAGGGYGVEIIDRDAAHHLVGVTTGVFTGTQVAITGSGIDAGTKVVVAQ
ncbi:MAG TPA: peptidoglycan-binding domain-containing protein [Acidimicrobiales bacterium]|nr:peptidoglycan-binding domain-containing protein [Acidimicrobiales bacterium]